jgi:hypothetical protein
MEPLFLYWVLTLVVLLILMMLTDVGTASIITTFIMVMKFMNQPHKDKNIYGRHPDGFETEPEPEQKTKTAHITPHTELPILKSDIILENTEMVDDIFNPKTHSADDRIFDASIISGYKEKKAKEIRSHWNNNNTRKYFDYEMGIHENREWWTDDDFELSKRHVVI